MVLLFVEVLIGDGKIIIFGRGVTDPGSLLVYCTDTDAASKEKQEG